MPIKPPRKGRRNSAPYSLVTIDHPIYAHLLEQRTRKVEEKDWCVVPDLVTEMLRILRETKGQGISAPQVGCPLAVSIAWKRRTQSRKRISSAPEPLIMINPKIIEASEEMSGNWEGCLSVTEPTARSVFRAKIERHRNIVVEYLDLNGNLRQRHLRRFWARIVQHEIDHLHGMLFLKRFNWSGDIVKRLQFAKL